MLKRRPLFSPFLTIALLLAILWAGVGFAGTPPISSPLVFVKYPSPENLQEAIRGNLYRLDPDGTETNLTQRNDVAVRDPEISWDGTRVVFSMRQGADTSPWQVWEVGVDGGGLRKVSQDPAYNDLRSQLFAGRTPLVHHRSPTLVRRL